MKNLKYILPVVVIVIAIVLAVISYFKCEKCKPQTHIHSFLIDISDDRVNIPDPISVADGYPFQDNVYHGGIFRLKTISSIHFSEVHEVSILKGDALTGNEVNRVLEVNQFFESIAENISSLQNNIGGTTHSIILKPLMEELEYLRSHESDHKALFVYSDLKEHSIDGGLNLYQKSTVQTLYIDPSSIREQIEASTPIPEGLEGIEVHFLYQSNQLEDLRTFEAMAEILKYLFEEQGAQVFIHSNLKTE
jgi:hypothetical protein